MGSKCIKSAFVAGACHFPAGLLARSFSEVGDNRVMSFCVALMESAFYASNSFNRHRPTVASVFYKLLQWPALRIAPLPHPLYCNARYNIIVMLSPKQTVVSWRLAVKTPTSTSTKRWTTITFSDDIRTASSR